MQAQVIRMIDPSKLSARQEADKKATQEARKASLKARRDAPLSHRPFAGLKQLNFK